MPIEPRSFPCSVANDAHWSADYLGLPYAPQGRSQTGVDCFGLVWLVLNRFGLPVPSYAGEYASEEERAEIAGLIDGAKPHWQRVNAAQELDLVTFRRGGLESHVGIVVKPGRMLHVSTKAPSCIERYDTGYWANRLTGIWRHALRT